MVVSQHNGGCNDTVFSQTVNNSLDGRVCMTYQLAECIANKQSLGWSLKLYVFCKVFTGIPLISI